MCHCACHHPTWKLGKRWQQHCQRAGLGHERRRLQPILELLPGNLPRFQSTLETLQSAVDECETVDALVVVEVVAFREALEHVKDGGMARQTSQLNGAVESAQLLGTRVVEVDKDVLLRRHVPHAARGDELSHGLIRLPR